VNFYHTTFFRKTHFKNYFFLLIHSFTLSLIFHSCTKDKIQETNQNEKLGWIMFCTSSESGSIVLKLDGATYNIPSISDKASDEIFDDKKLADHYINSFPTFLLPEGYHTFIGGGEVFSFNVKTFVKAGSLRVYNLYTSESVLLSSVENKIFILDCANIKNTGTLSEDEFAQGVTSVISYSGGDGRSYNYQVISSTGVAGLTATLKPGTFANGNGDLTYTITGTPSASGIASFALNIGGKTCTLTRTVATAAPQGSYGPNITDVEGNSYKTVYIGTQLWMAENLKTSKYSDGTTIPNITDVAQWQKNTTGAWCYYDNNAANNAKYGKLYNWYAVSKKTNGNKNLCPTGWHVPTDAEWTVLVNYLDGASVAGGGMKEVGTTNWNSPNIGATNSSLFTGLPGGSRDFVDGNYYNFSYLGLWWCSSESDANNAEVRYLYSSDDNAHSYADSKKNGFSVRCLRD